MTGGTLPQDEFLLRAEGLVKHFTRPTGFFRRGVVTTHAVCGVDLRLERGRTVGLVGESGSGKSTLARLLMGLLPPTSGSVHLHGMNLSALPAKRLREERRNIQIVFQDPYTSLNPVRSVAEIVGDPLRVHGYEGDIGVRLKELIRLVGLDESALGRYPHAFSGGQRQRIGIARALALSPDVVILDEPVSALDVSVQAQILNLLMRLQSELDLSYVFISHDLAVVRQVADEVAVMYLGQIVEQGPADQIFRAPSHHYTRALLDAVPVPVPRGRESRNKLVLGGDIPSPNDPPTGCRFRTRCPRAEEFCVSEPPELRSISERSTVACHFPLGVVPADTQVP